ncbi:IclR family transcriptional regulator [Microbacter sp. GSS18]|nr:IclR family transcriptional regulator [Microbacter sp. GSS18]
MSTSSEEATKLTAAGRLLALLGAFTRSDGHLTLSEISRHAGLSLSTTHRLVQELLAWDGLEVDDTGRYRLGPKILELASSSTNGLRLRERALPHLIDIHRRTNMTVNLAVRDGRSLLYLEALRPHPNYTGQNRIGGQLPLHVAAAGLVLLAFAPDEVVDEYLSAPLRRYTPSTVTEPDRFREILERVRTERYAVTSGTLTVTAGSVAAPVVGPDGDVVAAVGLIYFLEHHDPAAYVDLVRSTAARASRALSDNRPIRMSENAREFRRRHAMPA